MATNKRFSVRHGLQINGDLEAGGSTGTSGQVLSSTGTGVQWITPSGGGGSIDGSGTANQITYWVDSDTLGSLTTATYPSLTELSYVKGVTSAIQTQLSDRASLSVDNSFNCTNTFISSSGIQIRPPSSVQNRINIMAYAGGMSIPARELTLTNAPLSTSVTVTLPNETTTLLGDSISNFFTGSNTFTNTTGQIFRRAATQDGILLRGRAGGTGNFTTELVPGTLTASNVLTLPITTGTLMTGVGVRRNGTLIGTRANINFIPGTNVGLTVADDSPNEEVDVTVNIVGDGNSGRLVYQTSSGYTTSTNLFWDSTNSRLSLGSSGTVSARLHVRSTTEQVRVGYDSSNYYSTTVGISGGVTFDAVGTGASFVFSDPTFTAIPTITTAATGNLTVTVTDTQFAERTGLDAATTIATTGTAINGQRLMIRLKDNGTSRALTWNAIFASGGPALPTSTTAGKWMHFGFIYNSTNTKWMLVASTTEP